MEKEKYCVENIKECYYKGEHYSARSDGYVFRHTPENKRPRKLDNNWTLGRKNPQNGYMYIGDARVHIIMANAFLGVKDSKVYVVDHIDTNRCNNRIENLRWLTRLENVLNNEITRKKVELICGSIDSFLDNPSLLHGHETTDRNFEWMKSVSREEAQNCKEHWKLWAKSAKPKKNYEKGEIGDWIYRKTPDHQKHLDAFHKSLFGDYDYPIVTSVKSSTTNEVPEKIEFNSLTQNAIQRDWRIPTEFPCCPSIIIEHPLESYLKNLEKGKVFANNTYGSQTVIEAGFDKEQKQLFVLSKLSKDNMKSCGLT